MRVAVIATGIYLSIMGLAIADEAMAAIRKPTEIHAQGLGTALQALAKDRDFQVVCRADLVKDLRTRGISGAYTTEEALAQLLSGTDLTYRYLDLNTVTIIPIATDAPGDTGGPVSSNVEGSAPRFKSMEMGRKARAWSSRQNRGLCKGSKSPRG
jgi:hypothetical protein